MVCTKPFFTLPKIDFINNTVGGFNNINPYTYNEGIKGKLFKKDEVKRKLFKWEGETI